MGYQVYKVGKRWGGYGVPAICEHPDCKKEIDRGMGYACGEEPFSEIACDRYFCSKHLFIVGWDQKSGDAGWCKHEQDIDGTCDCVLVRVCERCRDDKQPFPYKPEHPDWIKHLLTDESWKEWREKNPEEVEELKNKS